MFYQVEKFVIITIITFTYIYFNMICKNIMYLLEHAEVFIISMPLIILFIYELFQLLFYIVKKEIFKTNYYNKMLFLYGFIVICLLIINISSNKSETITSLALSKNDVPFLTLNEIDNNINKSNTEIWCDYEIKKSLLINTHIKSMEGIPSTSNTNQFKENIVGIKTEYYDLKMKIFSKLLLSELMNQYMQGETYFKYNSNEFDDAYYSKSYVNDVEIFTVCFRFQKKVVLMQCYSNNEIDIEKMFLLIESLTKT